MPLPISRIVLGDCFDVLGNVPDESIDLVVTDPPYGAGFDFANDKLPESEFLAFTERWVQLVVEKLKPNGSIYCFIDKHMLGKFQSIMDKYLIYRNIITWYFEAFFNGFHDNYDNRSEFILFYTKSDDYTFNMMKEQPSESMLKRWGPYADYKGDIPFEALTPSMRIRQSKENYDKNPTNINRGAYQGTVIESFFGNTIKINGDWYIIYPVDWYQGNLIKMKRARFKNHPTEKPEDLIEKLVTISSNEKDIVLDPFMGSGTTCVVAKKLRRQYIGIEIDPGFHGAASKRVAGVKVPARIDDFL